MREIRIGKEMLVDVSNCDVCRINDSKISENLIILITSAMQTKIISEIRHQFTPHGMTMLAIIADSHIAIHTWPEYGYVSIDIFSCKQYIPDVVLHYIKEAFLSQNVKVRTVYRKGYL